MSKEHPKLLRRIGHTCLAVVCVIAQLALPSPALEAAPGSSTASAGSAPPPAASAMQSFQPDLFTGRATTSIPIAVPPGRRGLQPALALGYASSGRNGWLGVGWMLDAGYIERSTTRGVPAYSSADPFTFLFQGVSSELVRLPDGTYRAKDEGLFLRFEYLGVSGWEVRDTSGTRYRFGQALASQIADDGKVFRWALDQVVDLNGNTMELAYATDQGQLYLAFIRYTGHAPTSLAPANQVEFILEARPDQDVSLRSGFAITTAKRLKAIETKATTDGAMGLARRYELTYAPSPRTGRSLLTGITQLGSDGTTALPSTTFSYTQDATSYALQQTPGQTSNPIWNVRAANLDTGYENTLPCNPGLNVPWSAPLTRASGRVGSVNFSSDASGRFTANFPQDHFFHAWTSVYVASARTVPTFSADVGCLWLEEAQGMRNIAPPGPVPLGVGWSVLHLTGYHQHEGRTMTYDAPLISLVDLMSPTQISHPQLTADVDGNGTSDLITFSPSTGTWKVSRSQPFGNGPQETWLLRFGSAADLPLVGDWDADGLTDVALYHAGTWRFARSFSNSFGTTSWPTLSFGVGIPLSGDFNGDGNTDLGTYHDGQWQFALGKTGRFTPAGALSLNWGSSSTEPMTGDFNGDGLTDVGLVDAGGAMTIRLSKGSGWEGETAWLTGLATAHPHTTADLNGDGLTDLLVAHPSSGQVSVALSTGTRFGALQALPVVFTLRAPSLQLQVADLNGDTLSDFAVIDPITGAVEMARSTGFVPDLLSTIANGLGGATSLHYQLTSAFRQTFLPFVLPVVQQASVDDGLGHAITTTYRYEDGFYDVLTKEFRGFARVEVRDAEANMTVTEFHQDLTRKGRPFRTELRDAQDHLWTKTEQTWNVLPVNGSNFVFLYRTDHVTYDTDAAFKQVATEFRYDMFGNVIQQDELGDVALTGDERHTFNHYALNQPAWILNRLAHTKVISSMSPPYTGRTAHEQWFYYDGRLPTPEQQGRLNDVVDTTPPVTGNLTGQIEYWDTNAPADPNPLTQMTYDAYGNVLTVIDPLGRVTTNAYDPTGTYAIQVTNPVGHTSRQTVDSRTGQGLTATGPNGQTTTTVYDALGRVTSVIGPLDTPQQPTMRYAYDPCLTSGSCAAPIRTTAFSRVASGQAQELAVTQFIDGLGRAIQTRSPAQDPAQQIVTGAVEWNARGLTVKRWAPYLDAASSTYVPVDRISGLAPPTTYEYDPLGRVVRATSPDGASMTTAYEDWTTILTDANGHVTRRTQNAFGQLVQVEEFNGAETYATRYAYGLNKGPNSLVYHLTQVTDASGNVTTLDYDTLGRKVLMVDPDMGTWTYAYDATGNLISQTDARGVVTTFTYDALNRLTRKSYQVPPALGLPPPVPVVYTYDDPAVPFSKGRLTRITDGSGASSFVYDVLGRAIRETKTIDGTSFVIQRAYDLLGRLTTLTYPDGEFATYAYHAQGGIATIDLVNPATQATTRILTAAHYNAAGQLTKLTYGNGVVTDYAYNPQTLRLSSLVTSHQSLPTRLQDFSYTFDPVGNVTAITDRLRTATQIFQYDALNRLTQAVGSYGTFTYAYDPIGNMTNKEGVTLSYGLTNPATGAMLIPHAVTSTSRGLQLRYDATGNLLEKALTPTSPEPSGTRLIYDAENRLTEATPLPRTSGILTLQPGWNFISLPTLPSDHSIAGLFSTQLSSVKQISRFRYGYYDHYVPEPAFRQFDTLEPGFGYAVYVTNAVTLTLTGTAAAGSLTLTAGKRLLGNPTTQPLTVAQFLNNLRLGVEVSRLWRCTPTGFVLLTATDTIGDGEAVFAEFSTTQTWQLPGTTKTQFLYDGDGGRVKQITPQGTTRFIGTTLEIAPSGTMTKYLFAGSQRLAAQDSTGRVRFYHGDHLGSSNVITDQTGGIVELAEYTPYGSLAKRFGSVNVPQKFTGQRLDASTGLYFYNARYYDPNLGRFIQADPIVPVPGDPQALNRYAYCRNNPLKYTDPTGHGWFSKFWRAIVGVAATVVSVLAPPLAPAMWAVNVGISAATAIQTGNVAGFVGGLVGGAALGALGNQLGPGIAAGMIRGGASGGFAGAVGGAAEFALSGFGSGFGAALASGENFRGSFKAGGIGAAGGAVYGAAIQGSYMAGWQNSLHGFTQTQVAKNLGLTPISQFNAFPGPGIGNSSAALAEEQGQRIHPARLIPIREGGGVWIDRNINFSVNQAALHLQGNNMYLSNIWAALATDAQQAAQMAGGLLPAGPEISHGGRKPGFYWHYQPRSLTFGDPENEYRMNPHAWYGVETR